MEDARAAMQLSAVERELVSRNADYLFDIILKMYGPGIRRAIVEETLRRVADSESPGQAGDTTADASSARD